MTHPVSITLDGVSYQLPDGRLLFNALHEQFDAVHTGLVGRNGMGKSMLGQLLAGIRTSTSGTCTRSGTVHYLSQHIVVTPEQSVADLAGLTPVIQALANIAAGSTAQQDFDCVADRWDIHACLAQELALHNLAHLDADTPASRLSGGEIMRVALIGAFLSQADTLILDEPTNHLDRHHRQHLLTQLARWPGGLIVISHDRTLLGHMARIVELSPAGLRSYGGNYAFYAQAKTHEQATALTHLEQRKAERKREERLMHAQRERQEKRQARGKKDAANSNQAAILIGRQKERSEASQGKLRVQQDGMRETLAAQVRNAAHAVDDAMPVVLFAPERTTSHPRQIVHLDQLVLPHADPSAQPLNLSIGSAQRIGLLGVNGSGKSTLLRVIAGLLTPVSGQCDVHVNTAYLDQHLSLQDPDQSVINQLLQVNSTLGESGLRTRLAQLGLDASRVTLPMHALSGGERLKGALACALYADEPAGLLLLDEPSNHLDLASVLALEAMLTQYTGALIVVSHDDVFLSRLQLSHAITPAADGWHMSAWPAT